MNDVAAWPMWEGLTLYRAFLRKYSSEPDK